MMFLRLMFPGLLLMSWMLVSAVASDRVVFQFERKGRLLDPVVIGLYEAEAPRHASNFKKLVRRNFYRGMTVHRVIPGSLVQLGDPLSRRKDKVDLGTGGPGYTLLPEIGRRHGRGAVGMGRLPDFLNPGRLSNGSQFYVALKALPELDGQQTVFGEVLEGLGVWEEIGAGATDTNDSPMEPVTVRRALVVAEERLGSELAALKAAQSRPRQSWWGWLKGRLRFLF